MIRHVVLFRFRPGMDRDALEGFTAGLDALPRSISEIRGFRHGPDLGLIEGTWDHALVAEFDSTAAYARYADHPAHRAFIDTWVTPILEDLARVQYEV